jgi:hypothetical protein
MSKNLTLTPLFWLAYIWWGGRYAHFMQNKSKTKKNDFEGEQQRILQKIEGADGVKMGGANSVEVSAFLLCSPPQSSG